VARHFRGAGHLLGVVVMLSRLIAIWRFKRELNANLAARKRLRPIRQQAARKGWETRKAKA